MTDIGASTARPLGGIFVRAFDETLQQIGWPRGPLLLAAGTGLFLVLVPILPGITGMHDLAALAVLCAGVVVGAMFFRNLVTARSRTEAEIKALLQSAAHFDAEQLERALARYYGSAHTFLYFDVGAQVSLSQNVASVDMPEPDRVIIRFLQALEPRSIVVRPLGGTPRIDIVALDSRSVTLKLALPTDFIRLRIFGDIIPEIRNHRPDPKPVARAQSSAAR